MIHIRTLTRVLLLAGILVGSQGTTAAQTNAGPVPPADLSKIPLSAFADDELDLPYYLANFHRVANSIPLEGDLRGWITVSVWRGDSNQRTYNARVLESQLSLAYFYCTKREWNPYYGHPAVRARLEAVLERWCDMQAPDGKFSEYAEGRWGLAPTAFATKFTGETLRLLAGGPPINPELLERVKRAQRKALHITFTDPELWRHGKSYSNQFSNAFAGGLAWLALFPGDTEIRELLLMRMREASEELQSPAGYFYERDGPDWGYNLSTHHSNLHIAWHYARGTEFEPLVLEETRRFYDWMSWNAVIEPNGRGFILNRAIETRQRRPWIAVQEGSQARNFSRLPQAREIEIARAFVPSRQQESAASGKRRAELAAAWPNLEELSPGDFRAFTPYAFLHRNLVHWLPTYRQQIAAQEDLPYQVNGRFAHLRADSRHDVHFLYVRRPAYYIAFNSGRQIAESQRLGLGLLWTPGAGPLAQTQSSSNQDIWGTTSGNTVYEAGDVAARMEVAGKEIAKEPGARRLPRGDVTLTYPLASAGEKVIRFHDRSIRISTTHTGAFTESVPLLTRTNDQVRIVRNRIVFERNRQPVMTVTFDSGARAQVSEPQGRIGPYQVTTVRIAASDKLDYSLSFPPP